MKSSLDTSQDDRVKVWKQLWKNSTLCFDQVMMDAAIDVVVVGSCMTDLVR